MTKFFAIVSRLFFVVVAVATIVACSPDSPTAEQRDGGQKITAPASHFVQVQGRQFIRDAKPYFIVGANFWFGAYLGAPSELGDRERLVKELDLLQASGINNLRVLAISEQSELVRAVRPAVINAQGEFNQDILLGMDFLLAEMAKRDMTAVLYLNNFWQWSGGMSQYVSWQENKPVFDPDVTGEWNAFMQNSARFYTMDAAQKIYQQAIKTLVGRTNSITGIAYQNDPTIMSWQLANEPRPGSDVDGAVNIDAFSAWIKQTAILLHELAPQQLVSTGNEGVMGSIQRPDVYLAAHNIPEIDYLTFHMWVKNWGWYDATKAQATYPSALAKANQYVETHIGMANQLNKPIVLEEFGLERDGGALSPEATTIYRDQYYQAIFAQLIAHAQQGEAAAGFNIWAWAGYGRSQRSDYIWQQGDDFMGDPPQEPQGLNSVFDTDETTLDIIKAAADSFNQLSH